MKVIPERETTKMGSSIQKYTVVTILYHFESNYGFES